MKLTDFSALTFDCYGTLIDWETGISNALRPWAERHGVTAGSDDLMALKAQFEPKWQGMRPALLYPEVLGSILVEIGAELGVETTAEDSAAFGASVKDWPAFPDSAEALAYLKRHYKLVVVSNVDRASFAHSNEKLGVDFDLVITAEDVGAYKPDHAHFERMLAELAAMGVPKDKVLHTAQSLYHDHVPAKQIGLTSIWINRRAGKPGWGATPRPGLDVTPDWEVPTMAAMVELHKAHAVG